MYRFGDKEIAAFIKLVESKKLFRYDKGGVCDQFETRWAKYTSTKYCQMTSSGTTALTASLAALEIGPGDEVLVPACTYMATAIAVLAVGAIPVVVDIDESIMISPKAIAKAIGPRTKAIIPVHLWGLVCDMNGIMKVAKKNKLKVVEDCCQCVGGFYEGRSVGSYGDFGAFSFNFFKNMTCGEGGAIITSDEAAYKRASCGIDCCSYYWSGRDEGFLPFASNSARASSIEGAILSAQLTRLPGMIKSMRKQKMQILEETADTKLKPIKANSLEWECGSHVGYLLPTAQQAEAFLALTGGFIASKTGRHIYTEWDQLFSHQGGHVPAMNPYLMEANKDCRMDYSMDMCQKSLDIVDRAVLIPTHPDRKPSETKALIKRIREAAAQVL